VEWFAKSWERKVLASRSKEATIYNNAYSINDRNAGLFWKENSRWRNYGCAFCDDPALPEAKAEAIPWISFKNQHESIAKTDVKRNSWLPAVNIGDRNRRRKTKWTLASSLANRWGRKEFNRFEFIHDPKLADKLKIISFVATSTICAAFSCSTSIRLGITILRKNGQTATFDDFMRSGIKN